jgi:hypothetical protein
MVSAKYPKTNTDQIGKVSEPNLKVILWLFFGSSECVSSSLTPAMSVNSSITLIRSQ